MSNLALPNLSFASLDRKLTSHQPTTRKKLGFETYGIRHALSDGSSYVKITHHGSTIAHLSEGSVSITDAGWASSTTIARLHKVMVDNGLWPLHYDIAIRQRATMIITPDTMRKGYAALHSFEHGTANFQRTETGWQLLDIDTP